MLDDFPDMAELILWDELCDFLFCSIRYVRLLRQQLRPQRAAITSRW